MAGHSKWNNIKNKKGKEDAKRGKVFTKYARYIMVAAKEGGPDPEYNPSLKTAIEKAKAINMPNDNIDRAIKRGTGELGSSNFEEIIYEGYGPAGVAVLVSVLTDNRNRTASEVRHLFDKYGGNLGQSGSVSFMFDRKGIILIGKNENIDEENLMLEAIDYGAEDFNIEEEYFEILTDVRDFSKVRDELSKADYEFDLAEVGYIPQNLNELNDENDIKNMEKLIDALEDNDDIQDVYHNWDMPED